MEIAQLLQDETARRRAFPVCERKTFLAHAAVCPLPRVAADALKTHAEEAMFNGPDDYVRALRQIRAARETCARLIDATPEEIALLGPTSLGLSLFAGGLDWQPGDEVVYHADDYPANVYPWLDLARRGVVPRALQPERPGEITPEVVAAALTPRTRLVALASAYFLTGYRIDIEAIGQMLHERGVLFSLDAIQTLGAFPMSVRHVDFLAADAHKWMLGPLAAGIVYVKKGTFRASAPHPARSGQRAVARFHFAGRNPVFRHGGALRAGGVEPGADSGHGGFAGDARDRWKIAGCGTDRRAGALAGR